MYIISNLTFSGEDREQYRQHLDNLDLPLHEKDVLIDIVRAIMAHFVDAAFNVKTDQITLNSNGNNFNSSLARATLEDVAAVPMDSAEGGANPPGNPEP